MLNLENTGASSKKDNSVYLCQKPSLSVISDPKWRQFRFVLQNNRFFKVPDCIRNETVLQKWLVLLDPLDVYYSVARFLDPQKVGPRTEKISENMFLGADLVFDIDREPFSVYKIEQARKETIKLFGFLKTKNIQTKYIAFSGAKGFHVVCTDPFEYMQENPLEREHEAKKFRQEITKEMTAQGLKFDTKVTVDTRRILRLPGTLNSKTGLLCTLLSENELRKNRASKIIKKAKPLHFGAFRIRKEMTGHFMFRKILGLHRKEARSNPPFYFSSFLSSKVIGTKLHAPFLVFNGKNKQKAIEKIESLQEIYRLSDFFLFEGKKLFAIGLDALQPKRVKKILFKAQSTNRFFFEKYKQAFVQAGPKVDEKLNEFEKAPQFVCKVKSKLVNPVHQISRPHLTFLENAHIRHSDYQKQCGKNEYTLSHALIEN